MKASTTNTEMLLADSVSNSWTLSAVKVEELTTPLSIDSHCQTYNKFIEPVMAVDNNRLNNNKLDLTIIN